MLAAQRMWVDRARRGTAAGPITDTFNRTDSATDINPRSDGGTWLGPLGSSPTSVYGVSSNRGYIPTAGSMFEPVYADVGSLDTDVTVTNIRANSAGASTIWFCLDYANPTVDGYGLEFDASGTFTRIIDYRTATVRANLDAGWLAGWTGGSTTLRVTFDHSTGDVNIWQDSVFVHTWTVTGALSTGPGVGFGSNVDSATAGEFWDNFSAVPL